MFCISKEKREELKRRAAQIKGKRVASSPETYRREGKDIELNKGKI